MHSRTGLLILSAVAAALVAAVIVDSAVPNGRVGSVPRIIPEVGGAEDIARITWRRPGQPSYSLVRDAAGEFALRTTSGSPLVGDEAVMNDVIATLATLSYTRAVAHGSGSPARGLDTPRAAIDVELASGRQIELQLGDRISTIDRVWLTRVGEDRDYLLAGYAARAVDRELADLRRRQVVAAPAHALRAIELHAGDRELLVSGQPPRVHAGPLGGHVRADPTRYAALIRALGLLVVTRFVTDPEPAATVDGGLSLRVLSDGRDDELTELGPCPGEPDLRRVDSSLGAGCVPGDAIAEVAALVDREATFARRVLLPEPISRLTIHPARAAADGEVELVARGRAWSLEGSPASADAVDAWLDDLQRSTGGRYRAAGELTDLTTLFMITIGYAHGTEDRVVWVRGADGAVYARRNEEPIYLAVDEQPYAGRVLPATANRFRPRQILSLEPFLLRAASLRKGDAVVAELRRGELADDWRAESKGGRTPIPAVIDTLRELARLRATSFPSRRTAASCGLTPPRATVEVVFDPGPLDDAATRHVIELGARGDSGCCARLRGDADVFVLDGADCDTLTGAWFE